MTNRALRAAQRWLRVGVAVIPIVYREKRPAVKWQDYQTQLPEPEDLETWFAGQVNLAVVTGWGGLTVIDFDDLAAFHNWRTWAARAGGASKRALGSYTVRTARGVHVYVQLPEATKTRALSRNGKRAQIDIKSSGGYVLAPPSVHPSGTEYRALDPRALVVAVDALSDVLPTGVLIEPERDKVACSRKPDVDKLSGDPWADADRAGRNVSTGTNLAEQIKAAFPIEAFFPNRLQTGDHHQMTLCPFHDDRTPSFWIDVDKQICGCYAGCTGSKPYDVINLWARWHDLTNEDAFRSLARRL